MNKNEKNKKRNSNTNPKNDMKENKKNNQENEWRKEIEESSRGKKIKIHISYNMRLFLALVVFITSIVACVFLVANSFEFKNSKIVNYNEKQLIDYKVYLKENDFYEQEYLGKDMVYVASLIDKIKLDFNYIFNIEEKSDVNFDYKIIGNLVISNPNGNTNYFAREYQLLETKHYTMEENTKHNIVESIEIDYDYYNQLANNFKASYGVDTNSYLEIYLQVDKTSEDGNINIDDSSRSVINIPLSERSVEIAFNSQDTVSNKNAIMDRELKLHSNMVILVVICLIIVLISLVKTIQLLLLLRNRKNAYDVFINRVLREYDRLIVETTTGVDFENSNIINIEKFEELLDVRDNLKLPIMYYNIQNHQKCYFYIKNNSDVYLMKVKAIDMGVAGNEKEI